MSIARYIREIGRGRDGARSLGVDDAQDLMAQVLDGAVTDLEIGAFAIAMRIKGESVEELTGFLAAADARCVVLHAPGPAVVLPSYNGSRRIPNLTPLLAMLLAAHGVRVLVHGVADDGARVTTAEIFRDLGLTCARSSRDVEDAWSRREPAFMPLSALCPPLARLLDVRKTIGLRNAGHTIAKLLAGCRADAVLRVLNFTHPEYGTRLADFVAATRADAVLMRGTEGEPVADARRLQKMDVYLGGMLQPGLSHPGQVGVVTELPLLPRSSDAPTTASYIQSVVSGATPAPPNVVAQVDCLVRALGELPAGARSEATA